MLNINKEKEIYKHNINKFLIRLFKKKIIFNSKTKYLIREKRILRRGKNN